MHIQYESFVGKGLTCLSLIKSVQQNLQLKFNKTKSSFLLRVYMAQFIAIPVLLVACSSVQLSINLPNWPQVPWTQPITNLTMYFFLAGGLGAGGLVLGTGLEVNYVWGGKVLSQGVANIYAGVVVNEDFATRIVSARIINNVQTKQCCSEIRAWLSTTFPYSDDGWILENLR